MRGQFHDARIAAVCIENGVQEIWTINRDDSRPISQRAVAKLAYDPKTQRSALDSFWEH
jgi:hypothetical protein